MKKLITIIFTMVILTVQGQDLDPAYYLFGLSFDYSISTYPGKRLKRHKFNPRIHESDLGNILRLSEVTNKEFKKIKPQKDCRNCDEFYELKSVPWKLGEFYNFFYEKIKGTRPKKVTGIVKNEVIENASINQMKSFLAGIYNGFGTMSGDTIIFQFGHVNSKLEITERFIDSLDGAEFMKTIPVEKDILGGGPLLIFVPKGNLKKFLLNERKRINTLANRANSSAPK
ncbi:hypothetical protein GGR32_001972 [Mesonia hippocampi]|uniref:Uncharacterized protein n=1 Tax=Mesonia hippocampi TaxID=1628250 RepID=A0A840EVV6_9FLAO|nr:hypothetical protein [Mesonia hippocampi]MBB4119666.1 hypothetical protein [Mesonia hippocampi]